jgi:hypothetical protein
MRCIYGIMDDCPAVGLIVKPALDRCLESLAVHMYRELVDMLMKICETCPHRSGLLGEKK